MLNWTCTACGALNSPRQKTCWKCNYGHSSTANSSAKHTPSKNSVAPASTGKFWIRILQIFRIIGVIAVLLMLGSLFLPWVIRKSPNSEIQLLPGYTLIYGQITAVICLILLFFMIRINLAKGWYFLAIILALIPLLISGIPAQISQVYDNIAAELGGSEVAVAISVAGVGVTVANWAAVFIIIAAIAQIFRPTRSDLSSG